MLRGLASIDFSKLRLDGLGAYTALSLANAQQIAWDATPLGTSMFITEAAFKANITKMYKAGYTLISTREPSTVSVMNSDEVIANAESEQGSPLGGAEKVALKAWVETLSKGGYYFMKPPKAAPVAAPAAEPAIAAQPSSTPGVSVFSSPAEVAAAAATPSAGSEPTFVDGMAMATEIVKVLAPAMAQVQRDAAAREILRQQQAGKTIYKPKSRTLQWVLVGLVAFTVIGLSAAYAMRD